MPQMSPLSWLTIFIMLISFMFIMFNLMNTINEAQKLEISIKKKENAMKW